MSVHLVFDDPSRMRLILPNHRASPVPLRPFSCLVKKGVNTITNRCILVQKMHNEKKYKKQMNVQILTQSYFRSYHTVQAFRDFRGINLSERCMSVSCCIELISDMGKI